MPYAKTNELPEAVKELPVHAQEIYMAAFNSAYSQHSGEDRQEAIAHATAWKAVEQKYEQKDGRWVAKESTEPTVKPDLEVLAEDVDVAVVRCPVCQGEQFDTLEDGHLRCISCEALVESSRGDSFHDLYGVLLKEYGRRNAAADEVRVKRIIELANELLTSGEENTEEKANVTKQVKEAIASLQEQPIVKFEGQTPYPAEAYAYAPGDDPAEWKLRIREGEALHVALLERAANALSPGALHQHGIVDPEPARRKVRLAFKELGLAVPRWVNQATSRAILGQIGAITEADKGIARVVIIRAGFGNPVDNYYYPADVLRQSYAIFEGAKMYSNHATAEEEAIRPEGDIRQWVGNLKNVTWDESQQAVVGDAVIHEPWLKDKLSGLRDVGLLSEMGISIRAVGKAYAGTVEGKQANIVEEILGVRSVDFVTEAGAGGVVVMYEADARRYDVDLVNITVLKERRPDLVEEVKAEAKQEVDTMTLEERITELEGQVTQLTEERDKAQGELEEAKKEKASAEAKAAVEAALAAATDLPEAAKKRLAARFSTSAEGLEDAIKEEREYVLAVRESAKVKNLGPDVPEPKGGTQQQLKEHFKQLGLSEEQAEIAAKR